MGVGSKRTEARPLVKHRAIELNGHTADIASMLVKAGDVISIREKAKAQLRIRESLDLATGQGLPQWVEVDTNKLAGTFKQAPDRADVARDVNESMVVERSEEHTSELQSLMRISYAVFCLKKKKKKRKNEQR